MEIVHGDHDSGNRGGRGLRLAESADDKPSPLPRIADVPDPDHAYRERESTEREEADMMWEGCPNCV